MKGDFCALCLDDIEGVPRKQPLGRDDALVKVCNTCDSAHAVEKRGPEIGYPIPTHRRVSKREIRAAADRVLESATNIDTRRAPNIARRTPGYLLIRIGKRDALGYARDAQEAAATFAHEPWAPEVRYIGAERTWILFERPDPKVAAESRVTSENPLVWLEPFRVHK